MHSTQAFRRFEDAVPGQDRKRRVRRTPRALHQELGWPPWWEQDVQLRNRYGNDVYSASSGDTEDSRLALESNAFAPGAPRPPPTPGSAPADHRRVAGTPRLTGGIVGICAMR